MQKEIDAMGLPVALQIHGINETGHERSNDAACLGKDLPWLQEVPEQPVWSDWKVTYRDVVIIDEENRVLAIYNLTEHNLDTPADYEALKTMLVGFAGGE